jgi:hypothetical protein
MGEKYSPFAMRIWRMKKILKKNPSKMKNRRNNFFPQKDDPKYKYT